MPILSTVTACKGRFEHLQQTLPSLMAMPDCEVVVVDYDDPDGAGDWVRAHYPAAKLVQVKNRSLFGYSEARNLGAAAATSPWLFFIDADVGMKEGFMDQVRHRLHPGFYLIPQPLSRAFWGGVIVSRKDFDLIGGYDEVMRGWGSEDVDLRGRLDIAGVKVGGFPNDMLWSIAHGDDMRLRYQEIQDLAFNGSINAFYRTVKHDLMRQNVPMDQIAREKLYSDIRQAFYTPGGLQTFKINFRPQMLYSAPMMASLVYDFTDPRRPAAQPSASASAPKLSTS